MDANANIAAADGVNLGVAVHEVTTNAKMGAISVTHVAQASCPTTCPLLRAGCYAELGNQRFVTDRVNVAADEIHAAPYELALRESLAIRELTGKRKLRVHVVGDCTTAGGARLVGQAMVDHERKHGQPAWVYTHAWPEVEADDWVGARVLASVHSKTELYSALSMGYRAFALATPRHLTRKVYSFDRLDVIPCPAQFKTRGSRSTTCEHCRICQNVDRLATVRRVVGFEPDQHTNRLIKRHGQHAGARWTDLF